MSMSTTTSGMASAILRQSALATAIVLVVVMLIGAVVVGREVPKPGESDVRDRVVQVGSVAIWRFWFLWIHNDPRRQRQAALSLVQEDPRLTGRFGRYGAAWLATHAVDLLDQQVWTMRLVRADPAQADLAVVLAVEAAERGSWPVLRTALTGLAEMDTTALVGAMPRIASVLARTEDASARATIAAALVTSQPDQRTLFTPVLRAALSAAAKHLEPNALARLIRKVDRLLPKRDVPVRRIVALAVLDDLDPEKVDNVAVLRAVIKLHPSRRSAVTLALAVRRIHDPSARATTAAGLKARYRRNIFGDVLALAMWQSSRQLRPKPLTTLVRTVESALSQHDVRTRRMVARAVTNGLDPHDYSSAMPLRAVVGLHRDAGTLNTLGVATKPLGTAVALYRQAHALTPRNTVILGNLGCTEIELAWRRYDDRLLMAGQYHMSQYARRSHADNRFCNGWNQVRIWS